MKVYYTHLTQVCNSEGVKKLIRWVYTDGSKMQSGLISVYNAFTNCMRRSWLLWCILVLAFVLRIIYLDRMPVSISGDELIYPFTARFTALSGSDINGIWTLFNALAFRLPVDDQQAELLYFLHLPFSSIFGTTLFWVRLPFAILGVGTVLIMYLTGKTILNEKAGVVAGFLAAINPWLLFASRSSYEVGTAMFFFLLSFYLFLIQKKWIIIPLLLSLCALFYSYIGTKIIVLPYTVFMVYYTMRYIRTKRIPFSYIVLIAVITVLTLGYAYSQMTSPLSRTDDIFTPNSSAVRETVNEMRRLTINNPFINVFINKYSVYMRICIQKFFTVISPLYLFYEGDLFFSFWHGLMYVIDPIFILWGGYAIVRKKRSLAPVLFFLLFLSVIPRLIHRNIPIFSPHACFIIPLLIMICAYGVTECIDCVGKPVLKRLITLTLIFLYSYLAANFLHTYFFRAPLEDVSDFPVRELSRYLSFAQKENVRVYVKTQAVPDLFKKYLLYTNSITRQTIPDIQTSWKTRDFSVGSVSFISCDSVTPDVQTTPTVIMNLGCRNDVSNVNAVHISRLSDAGSVYTIANDSICSSYALKRFTKGLTVSDFSVESLSKKRFCEAFITKIE